MLCFFLYCGLFQSLPGDSHQISQEGEIVLIAFRTFLDAMNYEWRSKNFALDIYEFFKLLSS